MSGVFQITCFVKDTKLADILRLLDGKAYNVSAVPAHIGERPSGKASLREVISTMPDTFTIADVLARVPGTNKKSVYTAVTNAKRDGLLKSVKKGTYRKVKC
jgi:hypothetical protein